MENRPTIISSGWVAEEAIERARDKSKSWDRLAHEFRRDYPFPEYLTTWDEIENFSGKYSLR